jgi:hypothetical protein
MYEHVPRTQPSWKRREIAKLAANDRKEIERQERAAARELFTPEQIATWGTWQHPLPYPSPTSRPEQRHFRWNEVLGDFEVVAR